MDHLRLKISFFISSFFHIVLIVGINFIPKKTPIIVSFPVELITLPSLEKVAKEPELVVPVMSEKKEVIIPKKVTKVTKPIEQKKEVEKPKEQVQNNVQPVTQQSLTVETSKFPFSYYLRQIQDKISNNWTWSQSYSGDYKTVVYFRILRSGEISELKIKNSSGNKLYDNLCLRAVEVSSPFAPLPQGYEEDWLGVFFEFKYKD